MFRQVVEIYDVVHANEFASSKNNLGLLLKKQGKYAEAYPLFEQAIESWKKVYGGEEHSKVARGYDNLATLLNLQGKFDEAIPLCERALAIFEKVHGNEHPLVAQSHNNLGLMLKDQVRSSTVLLCYCVQSFSRICISVFLLSEYASQGRTTSHAVIGDQKEGVRRRTPKGGHQLAQPRDVFKQTWKQARSKGKGNAGSGDARKAAGYGTPQNAENPRVPCKWEG